MLNRSGLQSAWVAALLVACFAVGVCRMGFAQMPMVNRPLEFNSPAAKYGMPQQPMIFAQPPAPAQRGPLARLVRNPNASSGLPPYALTDQAGAIQRYVEPVPGIDLDAYVNRVVTVHHDTGRTLLASQLELPPQRLLPMVGADSGIADGMGRRWPMQASRKKSRSSNDVKRAAFVDNDDTTVQLMQDQQDEGLPAPSGNEVKRIEGSPRIEAIEPNTSSDGCEEYPSFPEGYPASEGQMMEGGPMQGESMYGGPMQGDPSGMQYFPGGMEGYGMEGYPAGADGYYEGMENSEWMGGHRHGGQDGMGSMCETGGLMRAGQRRPQCYGEVEINFLRPRFMEDGVGKLSEKHEFSPRFILGFQANNQIGARARYWTYGRNTNVAGGGSVRFEFDVLDLEATHAFDMGGTGVELAAGLRLAKIDLTDADNEAAGTDLAGLTFAADGRTRLCDVQGSVIAWAYGGRVSILGGDWGGDDGSDFVNLPASDDNVVSEELYVGIECAKCCQKCNVHARFAFEMQNWHSDALAQSSSDSIGFLGPGVHVGAEF